MFRLAAAVAALLVLLVILTQDFQIFAELTNKLAGRSGAYDPPPPGSNAADYFAITDDGYRIHFRRWAPASAAKSRLRAAILSHGNAGTMDDYHTVPKWLAAKGIATYVYDYRGYGLSEGWPSERGLYRDIDAIWREAVRRDQATPESTLAFGHSLGAGPSTYLAEKLQLAVLVTAATYTSVPERAALHPLFGALAPFVWTRFPNRDRIANLQNTCLIVLHAGKDDSMPLSMSRSLFAAYKGSNRALFAEHPSATHAGIVSLVPALAEPLLAQCQ
jgi:pimeloyl-ACP methyl ester carboxylesterase